MREKKYSKNKLTNIISNFLSIRNYNKFTKEEIEHFLGVQHRFQCKHILGEDFADVHKKMDKKRGGGKKHREYGHTAQFISKNFRGDKKLAAFAHLLGDFISDEIYKVIGNVLEEIKRGRIEPPYYKNQEKTRWNWDIKKESADNMVKKWGEIFIETLKQKDRE